MRWIATFNDLKEAHRFSTYLTTQGIENKIEAKKITDWESERYGDQISMLWIYDEDDLEKALQIHREYLENPEDDKFQQQPRDLPPPVEKSKPSLAKTIKMPPLKTPSSISKATLCIIIACAVVFLFSYKAIPPVQKLPSGIPYTPLISAPLKKALLYDYPTAYSIIDQIEKLYGIEALTQPEEMPPEGRQLLEKFYKTSYWHGIYDQLAQHWKNREAQWNFTAPMFEKIQQGQIYRLITPIFLHADIFHILFNLLWLIVLGKQMEQCLGSFRYLLFIVIVAAFSNTCQYLMSGPNFIGISGVICGMLTFIFMRQKQAPWEGYMLQPATFAFLLFFILVMFAIQTVSFFIAPLVNVPISIGIANTAHLSGALMGVILGCLPLFSASKS